MTYFYISGRENILKGPYNVVWMFFGFFGGGAYY